MRKASSIRFYMLLAAALVWMAVIFFKSAETYQQQDLRPMLSDWMEGSAIAGWLPHWSFTYDGQHVTWQEPYDFVEFFIRKAGHVSEFAILALLWSFALLAKQVRMIKALFTSSVIAFVYAASDEWHQTFVSGRTGHAIDVAIDAIGIVCAIALVLLLHSLFRIKRTR